MKEKTQIPYYLGIDAGSSSVGWAVTDTMYHVLKTKGKAMWGVRLFPDASTAAERRTHRAARRRLQRRKQRLDILEMLFAPALNEKDPQFLARMHESDLWQEDKSINSKYSLFSDSNFNDCDYHAQYPTTYHLLSELAHSTDSHDVRLVYLALHHLMKSRGHFLYEISETSDNDSSLRDKFDDFSLVPFFWSAWVRLNDSSYSLILVCIIHIPFLYHTTLSASLFSAWTMLVHSDTKRFTCRQKAVRQYKNS